jgi:hypothetical protein
MTHLEKVTIVGPSRKLNGIQRAFIATGRQKLRMNFEWRCMPTIKQQELVSILHKPDLIGFLDPTN